MGSTEFANYTLASASLWILTQPLVAGFGRVYVLAHEQLQFNELLGAFLGCQFLFVITAGLIVTFALDLPCLLASFTILFALARTSAEMLKAVYQKKLQFRKYSLIEFGQAILFLAAICFIIKKGYTLTAWEPIAIQAASLMVVSFPSMLREKMLDLSCKHLKIVTETYHVFLWKYGYVLLYCFILALFTQQEIIMLKFVGATDELAAYGSAYRYYGFIMMPLAAVHTVLLAMVQGVSTQQQVLAMVKKYIKLSPIALCAAVSAGIASEWIIPVLDKGKYPSAILTFQILVCSALTSFLFSPLVNFVMRFERFLPLLMLIIAAALLDIAANAVLIPRFGSVGAACTNFIASGSFNVAVAWYFFRLFKSLPTSYRPRSA